MKTIASNQYYTMVADTAKNRGYLTIVGYWPNRAAVANYIDDLKKFTKEFTRGWTVVTDVTQVKPPPAEVGALHAEAQKVIMAAGLSKTAEIYGADIIAKMALDKSSKDSGMNKKVFSNKADAEAWLDGR